MDNKLKQDERVYFRLGVGKSEGWGKVKGVQGFVVIVEPEQPVVGYEYTTLYVVDTQIGNPPEVVNEELPVANETK